MKTPIIILIVVLLLAGIGFTVYTLSQQNKQSESAMIKDESSMMEQTNDSMMTDETNDAMMEKSDTAMMDNQAQATYTPYTASVLESTKNTKRVLFFYANWCPTCRPADAAFSSKTNEIPQGISLIRVNYNDTETEQAEKDLAQKYGVTYQHTFVQIDENGNQVSKWNGGQIAELISNIK